jgi:hypothetical protein
MNTKTMTVTPKLAAEWLKSNHSNRPLNRRYVEEVCRALENGTFQTTHQGIAFDTQGRLRDGQHRLTAIVETGIAVKMLVTTGMTEEQLLAIDDGRRRSLHDVIGMTGNQGSKFASGIVKEMMAGGDFDKMNGKPRRPSRTEFKEFFERHYEAAAFAETLFNKPSSGFQLGYLAAVIARASYAEDQERLKHFAKVLIEGKYQAEEDEPIINLRNYIQRARAKTRGTSRPVRNELYAKTERTLWDWLRGQNSSQLYAAKEELFPLPDENWLVKPPFDPKPTKAKSRKVKPKE